MRRCMSSEIGGAIVMWSCQGTLITNSQLDDPSTSDLVYIRNKVWRDMIITSEAHWKFLSAKQYATHCIITWYSLKQHPTLSRLVMCRLSLARLGLSRAQQNPSPSLRPPKAKAGPSLGLRPRLHSHDVPCTSKLRNHHQRFQKYTRCVHL